MSSDATAYRMVKEAISLFRHYYGDYPQRIGLDRMTRHQEYTTQHDWYYRSIEISPLERLKVNVFALDAAAIPQSITYNRIDIPIEPLIFPDLAAWEISHLYMSHPMPDTVWAQWGDTTAKMDIWFTERGTHSIIWDEGDTEEEYAR